MFTKYQTLLHITKHGNCTAVLCKACPYYLNMSDKGVLTNCTLSKDIDYTKFDEYIASMLRAELMNLIVEEVV